MKRRPRHLALVRRRRDRRAIDRVALRPRRWPEHHHVRLVPPAMPPVAGPYDWARGPGP